MIRMKLIVFVLLVLPTLYWHGGAQALLASVEFATHYAEEGEHCEDHCSHAHAAIEKPRPCTETIASLAEPIGPTLAGNVLSRQNHLPRDRPPPLLSSTAHSLRAPPALIPA